MKAGGELKRPPVMSSGLPGSKLIVYELPRPGLHRLALASEGRESKLLFHQRNKNAVAAGTHSSGYSSRFSFRFPQRGSLRSGLNWRTTFRLRALSMPGGTDQSLNQLSASPVNERYNPTAVSAHEAISMRMRSCAPPCPIS